jgi:hypothetical protein
MAAQRNPDMSAYSTEFCHQFRRKIASQSTGKLPPIPDESCHPIRCKVATGKSERSDAELSMDNLMSSLLSMPIHIVPPLFHLVASGLSDGTGRKDLNMLPKRPWWRALNILFYVSLCLNHNFLQV